MGHFNKCCCCQPAPANVYVNTPTMLDGAGETVIAAAMQPVEWCDGAFGCRADTECGGALEADCGTLTRPSKVVTNNFSLSDPLAQINFSAACLQTGWKNVQAYATWPGQYGWVESGCCDVDVATPQSRYLTLTVMAAGNFATSRVNEWPVDVVTARELGGNTNTSFSKTNTASVDTFGNNSNSGSASSAFTENHYNADDDNVVINSIRRDISSDCTPLAYTPASEAAYFLYPGTPEVGASCGIVTVKWSAIDLISGTVEEVNEQLAIRAADAIAALPADGTTGDPDGDHNVYLTVAECSMVVTLTDDRVKFVSSSSSKVTNTALNGDDEVVVVVYVDESSSSYDTSRTLSDSYSFAAVKAEGAALLAEWDMGDDRVYPWRMDGETWRAPLVHRDAASSGPAITEGDYTPAYELPEIDVDGSLEYHHGGTLTWTNPTPFTGAVIGKPQAVGNGRYFDDHARVLQVCCPPGLELNTNGGGNWFCLSGWGELSPGTLPLTATHWPDVQKGGMFPKGAFMMQADEGVYFQKWAESLEEWPSANMARPFGRDRFLIDYDAATGIGDCTGTGTSAEEYAGDIILDSGDPFYAFRRFPDCRPIGSRLVITAAVQTSPGVVTLTVAENHWLLAGDVLDFYGVPGLTIGDAVATATPDTTVFTVAGTLTGSYSSGGYVTSHLTAEDTHRWDWTCPRHAFVAQTWLTTVRANGGYHYTQEQGYLPPAKKTSVLYFSPNAESFENGFNAGWGDMESDDCFPNRWHAAFLQAVADPLWKSPKQCSDDAAVFKTQPAPCTACTGAAACVDFFPLVEPLLAPPANAPAVPFFFPASFDGGLPLPPIHLCAVPDANPTIHALRAAWLACDLWKTVIHNKCTRTADPSGESGSIGAGNNDYGAGGNGGIGL